MRSPSKPISHTLIITISGLLFSFLLQSLQIFLPSRVPTLADVILNCVGSFTGSLIGVVPRFRYFGGQRGQELWMSAPLLLVGCWMACRLVPFVPSIDWGGIKHGLKPLLLHPVFSFVNIFRNFVAWSVVAHLCSSSRARPLPIGYFAVMILGVFGAQVLIVNRVVTLPNVLGAFTALIVWWGALRNSQKRLEEASINWTWSTIISTVWLSTIEIGQMWFSHHSPDISDPLLILLMALWIKLFRPEASLEERAVYTGPERRRVRHEKGS